MKTKETHVVTGAFGYSGKYIARRLLDKGHMVHTLTNSPERSNPFRGKVTPSPFHFDKPDKLTQSLKGVSVLYNTYWVRFNHKGFTHADALKNTRLLFHCAREAGVKKIVHVSITNPSEDSRLEYFRDKAILEKALIESRMSYSILRPAVLFGREDILINNIAWFLRKFPVFGVMGDGNYGIQPIYVDDLAKLAVEQGEVKENRIIDAIGPETFTYREMVEAIGSSIGRKRKIISIPPEAGYMVAYLVGLFVGDVVLTREEVKGLMAGKLAVDSKPAGETRLTEWATQNAHTLGRAYTSELVRRVDRKRGYGT